MLVLGAARIGLLGCGENPCGEQQGFELVLDEGGCFGSAQYAIGVWVEAENGDLDGCGELGAR